MDCSTPGFPVPPGICSNSCPLSRWCNPTISSSVGLFSSCLQSFAASGSFQMSQLFASSGQSIGVSASTSVLPMNTQDWFSLQLITESRPNYEPVLWRVQVGRVFVLRDLPILASGPITSWEIDGETLETVSDFIFLGLQNHCIWWLQPWN